MEIEEIKERIAKLADLPLHFGYMQSGDPKEIERVGRLVMDHFGLKNQFAVCKIRTMCGHSFQFRLDGKTVTDYHNYDNSGRMGHANVTMCIQDVVAEALCQQDEAHATDILPLFDVWTAKIKWNYS